MYKPKHFIGYLYKVGGYPIVYIGYKQITASLTDDRDDINLTDLKNKIHHTFSTFGCPPTG